MGLYLCVFAEGGDDAELDGVEVGGYDDFGTFRQLVADHLEAGSWGSRFPTLMMQPDSDTTWTPEQAARLESELLTIGDEMARLAPAPQSGWQAEVTRQLGLAPSSLLESCIDVDGEPLVQRLIGLARAATTAAQPIWFQ